MEEASHHSEGKVTSVLKMESKLSGREGRPHSGVFVGDVCQ